MTKTEVKFINRGFESHFSTWQKKRKTIFFIITTVFSISAYSQNNDTLFLTRKDTFKNDLHTYTETYIHHNSFYTNRKFKNDVVISLKDDTLTIFSNALKTPFIQICLGEELRGSSIYYIDSSSNFNKIVMDKLNDNISSGILNIFGDSSEISGPLFLQPHTDYRNDSVLFWYPHRMNVIHINQSVPFIKPPEDFTIRIEILNNKIVNVLVTYYVMSDQYTPYNTLILNIERKNRILLKDKYRIKYEFYVFNSKSENFLNPVYFKYEKFRIDLFRKRKAIIKRLT